MGKILCLMGKSSAGKDTIYKHLLEMKPELLNVVPYTTRPIRAGEENGREYYFITDAEVTKLENEGKIIEQRCYNTVHGPWKYMTVDDGRIDLTKGDYIYIGTLPVYEQLCRYYSRELIVPIYIEIDDGERLSRALERERSQTSPKYAEMCRRFLADEEDFAPEKLKAAGIERHFQNDDPDRVCKEILNVLAE